MKFLRVGSLGKEIPAILDNKNKIRDLTSIIRDLTPDTISFKILEKIKEINIENLPELKNVERIGACVSKPGNFFAVGLNYSEHAKETGDANMELWKRLQPETYSIDDIKKKASELYEFVEKK